MKFLIYNFCCSYSLSLSIYKVLLIMEFSLARAYLYMNGPSWPDVIYIDVYIDSIDNMVYFASTSKNKLITYYWRFFPSFSCKLSPFGVGCTETENGIFNFQSMISERKRNYTSIGVDYDFHTYASSICNYKNIRQWYTWSFQDGANHRKVPEDHRDLHTWAWHQGNLSS